MSDDIKKDRSPNYPKLPLSQAVELVRKLHEKIGKGKIKREAAFGALGYAGQSGASLGAIGVLNQYGLIDQDRGAGISITPLAISLLHPISETQEKEAKAEAALSPKVFEELHSGGFQHSSESAIANHLIQSGFTPDGAKKAAAVYLENYSFANLSNASIKKDDDAKKPLLFDLKKEQIPKPLAEFIGESPAHGDMPKPKKVLATYSIPIGANEATLTFTGESLSPQDFDALIEYVELFKKQFQRKMEAQAMVGAKSMKDVEINLHNAGG